MHSAGHRAVLINEHNRMADRICAPRRLHALILELRKCTKHAKNTEKQKTAIENGLPFDEPLQKCSQEQKSSRESLLIELTNVGRDFAALVDCILPSNVEAFCKAIWEKLKGKEFTKRYLECAGRCDCSVGQHRTPEGALRRAGKCDHRNETGHFRRSAQFHT